RHEQADGEPLGTERRAGRAHRMADVDGRRRPRPPVLVEETEVRREGARKRHQDAEMKRHRMGPVPPGPEALPMRVLSVRPVSRLKVPAERGTLARVDQGCRVTMVTKKGLQTAVNRCCWW